MSTRSCSGWNGRLELVDRGLDGGALGLLLRHLAVDRGELGLLLGDLADQQPALHLDQRRAARRPAA